MADTRITELPELLQAQVATTDVLPIVDVSASTTKKIAFSSLAGASLGLAPNNSIGLEKLNQSSTTKLTSSALSLTGVIAGNYGGSGRWVSLSVDDAGRITDVADGALSIAATNVSGLATVARTGAFSDLTGAPTIGTIASQNANSVSITGGSVTGIADLAIADGGTGASNATDARTNLGLGSLATQNASAVAITGGSISGISPPIAIASGGTGAATAGDARANLGLGSLATQDASAVAITGGSISGISDLAVADGGTGASNAADARANLGLAIGTNVQGWDIALEAIAGVTPSVDQLPYFTGGSTAANTTLTGFARTLLDDGDAATARSTLGLGTAATANATITNGAVLSGSNTGDQTIVFAGDLSGSGVDTITATIANDAVTAAKLADNSATVIAGTDPVGSGSFVGQGWLNSNTNEQWYWDGVDWIQIGLIEDIQFNDSSPFTFSSSVVDATATITVGLESQTQNTFFAAPSANNGAPTFRSIAASDLPLATAGTVGAVRPGTGLAVDGSGIIRQTDIVTAGTATKVTFNAQGRIESSSTLAPADIPGLDASKITSGQFGTAFIADNSVTASKIADSGLIKMGNVGTGFPTPDFMGQFYIDSNNGVYVFAGIDVTNGMWIAVNRSTELQFQIRWGGTYDVALNEVGTLNQSGAEVGLVTGSALPEATVTNAGVYLLAVTEGTGSGNAPAESFDVGDWVLSIGNQWIKIDVIAGGGGSVEAGDVLISPAVGAYSTVQDAVSDLFNRTRIATTSAVGVIRASSSIAVDSVSGIATVDVIDGGTY